MDVQLSALLEENKAYFSMQPNGRIKCEINGHEFPARYDAVAAFVSAGKYPRLKAKYDAERSLTRYEPFISKSKNFPDMLYCSLTGQLIGQSVAAIKKHMQGKKFNRNKERFANDQLELKAEPALKIRKKGQATADGEEGEEGGEDPEFWLEAQASGSAAATSDNADDSADEPGNDAGHDPMEEDGPGTSGQDGEAGNDFMATVHDNGSSEDFNIGGAGRAIAATAPPAQRRSRFDKERQKLSKGILHRNEQPIGGKKKSQEAKVQLLNGTKSDKQHLAEELRQATEAQAAAPTPTRPVGNKQPKKKNITRQGAMKKQRL